MFSKQGSYGMGIQYHMEARMISRIDHISIAVKDYEKALHFFQHVLGAIPGISGKDSTLKYFWQSHSMGDLSGLELLNATEKGSFLDNFFKKRKYGGIHHMTLQTPDIHEAKKKLEDNQIPYFGFNVENDYWKELFIHPHDAFGVLIQIAEFNPYDWLDESEKFPDGRKWSIEKEGNGFTLSFAQHGKRKAKIELTRAEIKELIGDLEASC
jgi:methylmalonyl-CoA/ethylmalonyl-CoA epimerase